MSYQNGPHIRSYSNSYRSSCMITASKSQTESSPRHSNTQRKSMKPPSIRDEYLLQIQNAQQQQRTMRNQIESPIDFNHSKFVGMLADRIVALMKHDEILATLRLNETSREFLLCRADEIIANTCIQELNSQLKDVQFQLHDSEQQLAHAHAQKELSDSRMHSQIASLNQTIQTLSEKLERSSVKQQQSVETLNIRLASNAMAATDTLKQSVVRITAEAAQRIDDLKASHESEVTSLKELRAKDKLAYENLLAKQKDLETLSRLNSEAKFDHLNAAISDLSSSLLQVQTETKQRVSSLEAKNSMLTAEIKSAQKQADTYKQTVQELEGINSTLQSQFAEKVATLSEENQAISKHNSLLSNNLNESKLTLQTEREKHRSQLAETKEQNEERVNGILCQLNAGEDQLLLALKESECYKERLREKEVLVSTISHELHESNSKLTSAISKNSEVTQELQMSNQLRSSLEAQLEKLRESYAQLRQTSSVQSSSGFQEFKQQQRINSNNEIAALKQSLYEKDMKLRQSNQRVDHLEIQLKVAESSSSKRISSLVQDVRDLRQSQVSASCCPSSNETTINPNSNRNTQLLQLMKEQQIEITEQEALLSEQYCEISRLREVLDDVSRKNYHLMQTVSRYAIDSIYSANSHTGRASQDTLKNEQPRTSNPRNSSIEVVVGDRLENAKTYFFGLISRMNSENRESNEARKTSCAAKRRAAGADIQARQEVKAAFKREVAASREVYYSKLKETIQEYAREVNDIEELVSHVSGSAGRQQEYTHGIRAEIQKHRESIHAIEAKILLGTDDQSQGFSNNSLNNSPILIIEEHLHEIKPSNDQLVFTETFNQDSKIPSQSNNSITHNSETSHSSKNNQENEHLPSFSVKPSCINSQRSSINIDEILRKISESKQHNNNRRTFK